MWHSSDGDRTLEGAEASLIREAVAMMTDELCVDLENEGPGWDPQDYGVEVFDRLGAGQRLALLAQVADALLTDGVPSPPLYAYNEAAVAAIYEAAYGYLQFEIDEEETLRGMGSDPYEWRRIVLAAWAEADPLTAASPDPDEEAFPGPECRDLDEWETAFDVLTNRVLWDRDFEDGDLFLDAPPDHAEWLKDHASISDDYFTAIPHDPTDDDVERAIQRLHELTPEGRGTIE